MTQPEGRTVLVRVAVLALGVRAALWAVGLAAAGPDAWLDLWSRWDAPHYLRVAEVGYRPLEPELTGDDGLFVVFFPLFPLTVRLASLALRDLVVSGLVVSYVASVAAAWFLYRLTRLDADHATSWRAVVLLFSFPTAYFMAAPYTEALFLASVLGCLHAARTRRWGISAAWGALATATRITGIALFPALAVEAWSGSWRRRAERAAWIVLVGAGLLAYLTVNLVVHGDPFAFVHIQRAHWNNQLAAPWVPVLDSISAIRRGPTEADLAIIHWGRLVAAAFVVGVLLAGRRHLRAADHAYAWTALTLFLMSTWLISLPRYVLVLYPVFVVGARWTRTRPAYLATVVVGAALQTWLFLRYAQGLWTF